MLTTLVICGVTTTLIAFTTAIWQMYAVAMIFLISTCVFWAAMEHASTGLHAH